MTTGPIYRILTVDDTPALHDDYRKIFGEDTGSLSAFRELESSLFGDTSRFKRAQAYEIEASLQGEKAVSMVRDALAAGCPFSLAFVDMRMPPGWDGLQTIEELWKVDPALQIVLCSAYSDYTWEDIRRRIGNSDNLAILKKPFDSIEVYQLGYALTRKWELARQVSLKMERLNQLVAQRTHDLQVANDNLQREMADRAKGESIGLLGAPQESIVRLGVSITQEFKEILDAASQGSDSTSASLRTTTSDEGDRARIIQCSERGIALAHQLLSMVQLTPPVPGIRTTSEPTQQTRSDRGPAGKLDA